MAHKKYNILPLSLKDEDKLNDMYNLEVLVQKTKREYFKYDMGLVLLFIGYQLLLVELAETKNVFSNPTAFEGAFLIGTKRTSLCRFSRLPVATRPPAGNYITLRLP
jgi:hypothetical protein